MRDSLSFLSDEEIDQICRPRTQGAAQIRFLRSLGLTVHRRLDGSPLVNRAHYDAVMGGQPNVKRGWEPTWGNAA